MVVVNVPLVLSILLSSPERAAAVARIILVYNISPRPTDRLAFALTLPEPSRPVPSIVFLILVCISHSDSPPSFSLFFKTK